MHVSMTVSQRGRAKYIIPSRGVGLWSVIIDKSGDQPERPLVVSESRSPYSTVNSIRIFVWHLQGIPCDTHLVDLLVSASRGSCSRRFNTWPINFQLWRSLLAWIGIPGKALKLEEAQKKVLSRSGTKIQLGSGWKPGNMGL